MGLDNIYKRLNMTPENGLCIIKDNLWKGKLPRRLEFLIKDKLKPDAFFIFDKKPLILFYDSPKNREELFKAIWNFNESAVVIINESNVVEIFNGFSYLKNELPEKSTLEKLEDEKNLNNFSYYNLVTGKSLEHYYTKLKQQNRVDSLLLENIRDARKKLIDNYPIESSLANALIGKCIFVRYLIDRGVNIEFEGKSRKWTNNEFCDLFDNKTKLIKFFRHLRTHFNGEAFLRNDDKLKDIPEKAFSVLKDLLMGTKITSGQQSLFDIYDFSIIPVEFISNVYEFFIGEEKQAEKGAYYTPKFLVDYILTETVEKYFDANPRQYNCKVLDPACGSGIFLVEALRRIIEQYLSLNNEKIAKKVLKRLAEDNIFGIDKDENAINVAIFSIYLALLDYQEPKDIEKFTFPNLQQNGNFFVADFFDTSAEVEYNSRFSKINFNFIIGNPPWKRGASKDELFMQYIKDRRQKESNRANNTPKVTISNNEIAQAFILRTSDFSCKNTKCALIVTSKTLYNLKAKRFRCYFLHNYFVDRVFELAPVRKEIFDKSNDKAIAPATILFFRYSHSKNTELNELIHLCLKSNKLFSLFKIFVLQRTDIKRVVQKRLMDHDWLWKVLVYGSYMDFNFIQRLKNDYSSIEKVTSSKDDFIVGTGIQFSTNEPYDATQLHGKSLIDVYGVEPFYINHQKVTLFKRKTVHRIRNPQLFNAPVLLIRKGLDSNLLKVRAAIAYNDFVFKDSLTGVKPINKNRINELKNINGLLFSDLFSYFACNIFSSIGIEREQAHNKDEKFAFPFIDNPEITRIVKKIENISKKIHEEKQRYFMLGNSTLKAEKQKLINQLDEEIFNSFNLDEQELALVDYAINITIPLITRQKGYERRLFSPIPFTDNLLEDYLKIFLSRFEASFREKQLKAEIWHTDNIVGIFFKVISDSSSDTQKIEWLEKKNEKLLEKIASLGTEKITEDLFIQKDIRGFEKKGFYIIKPNEKKLWHKAIGYLDADEFMDAILKAGKEAFHV